MIAASMLSSLSLCDRKYAGRAGEHMAGFACIRDGREYEIDDDGEVWMLFPKCVKCGHKFADPDVGLVCCVCLQANS